MGDVIPGQGWPQVGPVAEQQEEAAPVDERVLEAAERQFRRAVERVAARFPVVGPFVAEIDDALTTGALEPLLGVLVSYPLVGLAVVAASVMVERLPRGGVVVEAVKEEANG